MHRALCLRVSLLLLAVCLPSAVHAASPVWKVTGPEGGTLYVGGSVHALRESDYPLPAAFDQALAASSRVVFEVDEKGISSKQVLKQGEYPRGDSLQNHVDPRTYAYLRKVFGLLGVPEAKFSRYRPWFLTLLFWSSGGEGLSSDLGVESYLTKRARAARKPTLGLVTAQEHLNVFVGLSERQSEAVLLLTFIPQSGTSRKATIALWRKGDVESLWRQTKASFSDYPAFAERIIEARNRMWLPKIESYLRSKATCFVVVGAAHLGGPEGVLNLLKQRGCKIEQL